jgi:hypothetical protein
MLRSILKTIDYYLNSIPGKGRTGAVLGVIVGVPSYNFLKSHFPEVPGLVDFILIFSFFILVFSIMGFALISLGWVKEDED